MEDVNKDHIKNLSSEEGIKKLQELGKGVDVCMFCTDLGNAPFQTRPMSTQEVDDQGNFWFLSDRKSDKNFEIKQDDKVQLLYGSVPDNHYLNVFGTAYVYRDQNKIDELYSPMVKAWFDKNDPDLTIIRVQPQDAYYWDTKHGKVVSLIKIAVATVTGKKMDDSIEGKVSI